MIYDPTTNAISSPESEFGATPRVVPDGMTPAAFGRALAPANLSATQAKNLGLLTSGTFGRLSTTSLASDALAQYAVSKLQAKTAANGSTLYKLTWKRSTTPYGRSLLQLRASAARTNGTVRGGSGWPTATATDARGSRTKGYGGQQFMTLTDASLAAGWPTPRTITSGAESAQRKQELGRTTSGGGDLQAAAMIAGWPTPITNDAEKRGNVAPEHGLAGAVSLATWASPQARDWKDGGAPSVVASGRTDKLPHAVQLATWPTPQAGSPNNLAGQGQDPDRRTAQGYQVNLQDAVRWTMNGPARLTASGVVEIGCIVPTGVGVQLHPGHARWLMGCHEAWEQQAPNYNDYSLLQALMEIALSEPAPTVSEA